MRTPPLPPPPPLPSPWHCGSLYLRLWSESGRNGMECQNSDKVRLGLHTFDPYLDIIYTLLLAHYCSFSRYYLHIIRILLAHLWSFLDIIYTLLLAHFWSFSRYYLHTIRILLAHFWSFLDIIYTLLLVHYSFLDIIIIYTLLGYYLVISRRGREGGRERGRKRGREGRGGEGRGGKAIPGTVCGFPELVLLA